MAVLQLRLRGLIAAVALASCGASPDAPSDAEVAARYLSDPAFRRAALVDSLAAPETPYATLRLRHYESGDARDWSRLPVWNPPAAGWRPDETDHPVPQALAIPEGARRGELPALRALGEAAFWAYPAQLASSSVERADAETLARHGVLFDGPAVGLRRITLPDGSAAIALTCAACHTARSASGALVPGLMNASLDLGGLAARDAGDPSLAARHRAWGAGRVDVTTADGREPVAIPDLRAVRFERYLQRAGAVAQRSLASLAVRVETLLITSLHASVRPPREVSLGLAVYLWSLGDALGPPPPLDASPGARIFASRCARCHAPPAFSGARVPAEEVGTEPSVARSIERGTGLYRVPSLRGVGDRAALLHDGAAAGIDGLFDPERVLPGYLGSRREGPIVGHAYGLDLSTEDRAALLTFLRTL